MIKIHAGTDGSVGYSAPKETLEIEVEVDGIIKEKMSLSGMITAYVLPALRDDISGLVDRSQRIAFSKNGGDCRFELTES